MSDAAVQSLAGAVALRRASPCSSIEDAADHPEWDEFVARTFGGDLAQTSAWGRIKHSAGMDVHRILARVDGEIAGGAQLLVRPLPVPALGRVRIRALRSVCARPKPPTTRWRSSSKRLRELCRRQSIAALVVQPPQGGEKLASRLRSAGFRSTGVDVAPSASVRVDLGLTLDEMLARMNRHTRREFRQSLRAPVSVRERDP